MTTVYADLEVLKVRASELANAAESLATLLDEEANRLKRGAQVERLHQLRCDIAKDLEAARQAEDRARSREIALTQIMR